MKLNKECIPYMVTMVKNLPSLYVLDLSSTGLLGNDIELILKALSKFTTLKSLNLSFNSAKMPGLG